MADKKISKINLSGESYEIDVATNLKATDILSTNKDQISKVATVGAVQKPDGTNNLFDENNKISSHYISDTILGQLKFGGTLTGYHSLEGSYTINPSQLILSKLYELTDYPEDGAPVDSLLLTRTGDPSCVSISMLSDGATQTSYSDTEGTTLEGFYFISAANLSDGHAVGDWLVINNKNFEKIDNTDTITHIDETDGDSLLEITGTSGLKLNGIFKNEIGGIEFSTNLYTSANCGITSGGWISGSSVSGSTVSAQTKMTAPTIADTADKTQVVNLDYFENNATKVDWENIDSEVHVINDHNVEIDGGLTVGKSFIVEAIDASTEDISSSCRVPEFSNGELGWKPAIDCSGWYEGPIVAAPYWLYFPVKAGCCYQINARTIVTCLVYPDKVLLMPDWAKDAPLQVTEMLSYNKSVSSDDIVDESFSFKSNITGYAAIAYSSGWPLGGGSSSFSVIEVESPQVDVKINGDLEVTDFIADYAKVKNALQGGTGSQALSLNTFAYGHEAIAGGAASHAEGIHTFALGEASHASGFLTLAGVKGWTIVDYTKNGTIIKVSDANQTLTPLLDLSRTIYYNVRLSVSHYDMWGTVQGFERSAEDENIVLLTISNSIPESYIEEALPDRNTIIFYAPFLDEEIDDKLTNEELETSVKNSLTYKLLTEGDVTIGAYTSASGYLSYAFKTISHAEGYFTRAIGKYSHAEGRNTISGYSAHAEGYGAQALGLQSHAEGYYTLAKNYAAHAEGDQTEALGHGSHAEGMLYDGDSTKKTQALANGSHAEGQGTVANGMGSHTEGGLTQTGGDYEGTTYGGGFAHAEGFETKALMARSHAEGEGTKTLGQASHAEGGNTTATGKYSHAEGNDTKATGINSHAEGLSTISSGNSSHSEGRDTVASGNYAHAEGMINPHTYPNKTKTIEETVYNMGATGEGSHTEGINNIAAGQSSHAEGFDTAALSYYSHAEGYDTIAQGISAHTEGYSTQALEEGAHAEGRLTLAILKGSHAEGTLSVTNGHSGHAEGYGTLIGESTDTYKIADNGTTTKGYFAHAEGVGTHAEGAGAHAEGRLTVASGNYSHAEGYNTKAIGAYSHAGGVGTTASEAAQTVIGKYNATNTSALFIIGKGSSASAPSNALTVDTSGNAVFAGTIKGTALYEGGTALSTKYALKSEISTGSSGITVSTEAPTDDMGEEGDIYLWIES